jgi:hypothetical protein
MVPVVHIPNIRGWPRSPHASQMRSGDAPHRLALQGPRSGLDTWVGTSCVREENRAELIAVEIAHASADLGDRKVVRDVVEQSATIASVLIVGSYVPAAANIFPFR